MKRFTGTEKWDKQWFRKLDPRLKLLWLFILDRCDSAGIWDIDMEAAGFFIGQDYSEQDLDSFSDRIQRIFDRKVWIKDFVDFQYGTLSPMCKPHLPVIKRLNELGLIFPDSDEALTKGIGKGIGKGFQNPQEKDKEQEKEKDKEKDQESDEIFAPAGSRLRLESHPPPEIPSVDDVVTFGKMSAGIPEDFCRNYHSNKEIKRTWTNHRNELINWRLEVQKFWNSDRHKYFNGSNKRRNTQPI